MQIAAQLISILLCKRTAREMCTRRGCNAKNALKLDNLYLVNVSMRQISQSCISFGNDCQFIMRYYGATAMRFFARLSLVPFRLFLVDGVCNRFLFSVSLSGPFLFSLRFWGCLWPLTVTTSLSQRLPARTRVQQRAERLRIICPRAHVFAIHIR